MKNRYKYFDKPLILVHGGILILSIIIPFFKNVVIDFYFIFYIILFGQFLAFIFVTLPILILFLNYKKYSQNWFIQIDLPKTEVYINDKFKNEKHCIKFDEIAKVYKVKSYNKSSIHFGYMDFFYFEVIDKNDKSYIITCLVEENLDKYIDKNKVKLVSKFFPYIKYSEHETN